MKYLKLFEEQIEGYYVTQFCYNLGGHSSLSNMSSDFQKVYDETINFYNREKRTNGLGDEGNKISCIEVYGGGSSKKFAIFYITEKYLNDIDISDFMDNHTYNKYMEVAKKCLLTNSPQIGEYDDQMQLF